MSILITPSQLGERAAVAQGPLAPLAKSLAADLDVVIAHDLYFPTEKALLSREGGRCAKDGTLLDFDPFNRYAHRCPRCGTVYRGAFHERFWIYWYQLWLIERAVHGATLGAVLGEAGKPYADYATRVLEGYADGYWTYPNVDNVLGPSRLFFSTYLESIWLLNVCIAVDLLGESRPALKQRVLDRIVEPARAIIAQYDEGGSNRQVWNDAALLAAARLSGDTAAAERAVYGGSGVAFHLSNGLLDDGTWFEGENYHLFAHRGLWYGVTMAAQAGLELPTALEERFDLGFRAPFATALPDFTLPARRDSQYGISLRQWRIAEHCELGVARVLDARLVGALQRLYSPEGVATPVAEDAATTAIRRGTTGRDRSSADVERNEVGVALTRADLSWRALLFARPELPAVVDEPLGTVLLEGQGIAVFRRDQGQAYVALDYGQSGGGHGHPDRLNLLIADGSTRWLDDFGTGSYTDPSLHWYRSTLAHNAPLMNGRSQPRVDGHLLAFDENAGIGWAMAAIPLAAGVMVMRTLVVMPTYVLDTVVWQADMETVIDLPIHADLELWDRQEWTPHELKGFRGLEDGFGFVRDTAVKHIPQGTSFTAGVEAHDKSFVMMGQATENLEWWGATAPGAPGTGDHRFRVLRSMAADGAYRLLWSWRDGVVAVQWKDEIRVFLRDGGVHLHAPTETGWRVTIHEGGDERTVHLQGMVMPGEGDAVAAMDAPDEGYEDDVALYIAGNELVVQAKLAEAQYRRSEQTWHQAGEPSATLAFAWRGDALEMVIVVPRSDCTFAPADAVNPYDNEPADINGDGVQVYVRTLDGLAAWMLIPEHESNVVRIRRIAGWDGAQRIGASWKPWGDGYRMDVRLPGSTPPSAIDVIINEMPRGRTRRRGQLVLSGGAYPPEFVYLRGDRHDPNRLIPLRLADV